MMPVAIWKFSFLPWYALRCPKCGAEGVKRTQKRDREKTINTYIPFHAYYCENCRYRFYNVVKVPMKTLILGLITFFILFSLVTFFFFSEESILETLGRGKKQDGLSLQEPVFSSQTRPGVSPKEQTEGKKEQSVGKKVPEGADASQGSRYVMTETSPILNEERIIAGTIKIGDGDKYGIHWIDDIKGLRITRILPGPMMKGGIKADDIIVSINGIMALDSDLIKLRDDIRSGNRQKASMEVLRDGKVLSFTVTR